MILAQLLEYLQEITPNPNLDAIPKEIWSTQIMPEKVSAGVSWRYLSSQLEMSYCGSSIFKAGLSRQRMTNVAIALKSQPLLNIALSDIYWDKILSINELGIEEVYDATVPETHNFLANDFIVHNSIEQDADVVMFIYRKSADRNYRPEDIPPDEKNIAEIHIAKHRNGPTGVVKCIFNEPLASFRNLDTVYTPPAPSAPTLKPKSAFVKPAGNSDQPEY